MALPLHPVTLLLLTLASPLVAPLAAASAPPLRGNHDESKVAPYTLPDVLRRTDGTAITSAAEWTAHRPALLEIFSREIYGRTPPAAAAFRADALRWTVTSVDRQALGGRATRKEITVAFHADPGITLSTAWMRADAAMGIVQNRATEKTRGAHAFRWEIERVLARGYATVTAYYGDLCPDYPEGFPAGVAALFPVGSVEQRPADAWGAIGVWAWGLSRILDVLSADPDIDATRVAVHGHSRLGKAALWAGAQDPRFAVVISNDSGAGGAALSKRDFGETVAMLNAHFPHWFARSFRRYNGHEADLPVDQHQLIALIAPRPVYVASATEDLHADPKGEFLAAQAAEPVYALFGRRGLGVGSPPPPEHPVGDTIGYHLRTGAHNILAYDWDQFMAFADRHLKSKR